MTELEWMRIFAGNLQSLMDELEMSQSELSRRTGISQGTISRYLRAETMPSVNALVNIACVFPWATINDLLCFYERLDPRPSRRW